jgi:hypothetical protein
VNKWNSIHAKYKETSRLKNSSGAGCKESDILDSDALEEFLLVYPNADANMQNFDIVDDILHH